MINVSAQSSNMVGRLLRIVVPVTMLSILVAVPQVTAAASARSGDHAAAAAPAPPSGAALSGSPGVPIADPSNHTLYVPIQCLHDFCSDGKPSHDVDLIDTAQCTSAVITCHVVAKARAGTSPLAAALDRKSHTLYVANAGGTDPGAKGKGSVSVFDTRHCRVGATSGCHQPVATIHTGGFLVAATLDPDTGTLYLANLQGSVIVADVRTCNANEQGGCAEEPQSIADHAGPAGIAIDEKHSTAFVSNAGEDSNGNTVSLVNAATCNSATTSGCSDTPHDVTVGGAPFWDTVNQKTDTVYVASGNDDAVSLINARTCNATVIKGCTDPAKTVAVGNSPQFVAVDPKLHSLFALTANDDTVAALNTRTCRAGSFSKCPAAARSAQAASEPRQQLRQLPERVRTRAEDVDALRRRHRRPERARGRRCEPLQRHHLSRVPTRARSVAEGGR